MSATGAVISVVLCLAGLVLVIGLWGFLRISTAEDFCLAKQQLGAWRGGLSQAAGAGSFWILTGISAAAYTLGHAALWALLGILLGAAILWFAVGPAIRRLVRITSLTELRNAPRAVQLAVGPLAGAVLVGLVAQLGFAGQWVAHSLHWPVAAGIVTVGVLVLIAPVLGGMRAVATTGAVISVLLPAGALLMVVPGLMFLSGLTGLSDGLALADPHALDWSHGAVGWRAALLVFSLAGVGLALIGQPQVCGQVLAMRDERAVRRAGCIAIAWLAVTGVAMLVFGWCARVLYSDIDAANALIPEVTARMMPPPFAGLAVFLLAATVLVTASQQLLLVSSAATLFLRREDSSPSLLRLRVTQLIAGALVTAVAALLGFGSARLFEFAWLAAGVVLGPLLIVRARGIELRPGMAAIAMRAGLLATLLLFLPRSETLRSLATFVPFLLALVLAFMGRERAPLLRDI